MAAPQTTAISIAEMAQEKLEKLQIRRENQALLERIKSIGSQREKDLEEIRQKYEAALETNKETLAKIEELERKVAERDREVDEFVEDLQRFKGTVEEFLRTRASDDEIEDVMSAVTVGRYSSSLIRGVDPEDEPRGSIDSPAPSMPTSPSRRAANRKSSYTPRENTMPKSRTEAPSLDVPGPFTKARTTKENFKKPNPSTEPTLANRKRPTDTRPTDSEPPRPAPMLTRQRSRSASREFGQFAAPSAATSGPPKIPKLSQDRRPLSAYYKAASVIYASLGLDGGEPEFGFVSSFITGISSKKEKNQLIDSLANFCYCDIKEDGTREILCSWDEVMAGLREAKLVRDETVDLDKAKGNAAANSPAARNAAGMSFADNLRATEISLVAEQPAGSSSRRGKATNATQYSDSGARRHDLKKTASRSERPGNSSGSTGSLAINKPGSTTAKSGAAIEKPEQGKADVTEKPNGAKGKANSRVAKRPAPKKGKNAAPTSTGGIAGPDGRPTAGNQAAAEGTAKGGRRGRARAAKR